VVSRQNETSREIGFSKLNVGGGAVECWRDGRGSGRTSARNSFAGPANDTAQKRRGGPQAAAANRRTQAHRGRAAELSASGHGPPGFLDYKLDFQLAGSEFGSVFKTIAGKGNIPRRGGEYAVFQVVDQIHDPDPKPPQNGRSGSASPWAEGVNHVIRRLPGGDRFAVQRSPPAGRFFDLRVSSVRSVTSHRSNRPERHRHYQQQRTI